MSGEPRTTRRCGSPAPPSANWIRGQPVSGRSSEPPDFDRIVGKFRLARASVIKRSHTNNRENCRTSNFGDELQFLSTHDLIDLSTLPCTRRGTQVSISEFKSKYLILLVGVAGFEPATASRTSFSAMRTLILFGFLP